MFGFTFNQIGYLFMGLGWTLVLSLLGFVGGAILGLPLALARSSRNGLISGLASVFVQFVQGIPLPVIMFVVYFGISIGGYEVPALTAAAAAMTLFSAAYLGEIWRGCIQAVPKTQWEAAACLALTPFQLLVYIILPQATRIAIPPTVGFMVQIVKNTSYSVVIGFTDLSYAAKTMNNSTFRPFAVFTIAAVLYFGVCFPLAMAAKRFERRLQRQ